MTDAEILAEAKRIYADRLQRPGEFLIDAMDRTCGVPREAFELLPELIRLAERAVAAR